MAPDPSTHMPLIRMLSEEDSRWERRSWPEIQRLATDVPEAGIHFQSLLALFGFQISYLTFAKIMRQRLDFFDGTRT